MSVEIDTSVLCPSCGELAAPEQDGDVQFYACGCGMHFGYRVIPQEDPSCQLGIPEETRRQFPSGGVIPDGIGGTHDHPPVFLGMPDVPA